MFALLKHLKNKRPSVPIYDRRKAFEFLRTLDTVLVDSGQLTPWLNQRVASALEASIRRGPHRERWETLLFYRNHDIAHRQSFDHRRAKKLSMNDCFELIRLGKSIQTTLDGIYLNWRFATRDPEVVSVSQGQLAALARGEAFSHIDHE